MDKKAKIRSNQGAKCPFGLPIPIACENAGNCIKRMAPVESVKGEERDNIGRSNKLVYIYHKEGKRCPYADKIMLEHSKVDCDFMDTGEGLTDPTLRGSPIYPKLFTGQGYDGIYTTPFGYYGDDNNRARNLFFGIYSLLGKKLNDVITKYSTLKANEDFFNKLRQIFKDKKADSKTFNLIEDWFRKK